MKLIGRLILDFNISQDFAGESKSEIKSKNI